MGFGPDDVGQSLGLPDFVDPADVVDASFDASQTWGEERAAPTQRDASWASRDGDAGVGEPGGAGSAARRGASSRTGANRSSLNRSASSRSGFGASGFGVSGSGSSGSNGFGSDRGSASRRAKGGAKRKKQLTWAEKAERKEKRAAARREAEAAEREKDPIGFAREIVLTQLTMMPRSRAHLAGKLREKEVGEDVIDAVLDRMEDVGLVDDQAYADLLVRTQVASRGLARRALRQELTRKGIDEETASIALEQVDDEDEREQALVLARKKIATMSRLDEQTQTRRLAGLLARKGYSSSMVWSVIKQVQQEQA